MDGLAILSCGNFQTCQREKAEGPVPEPAAAKDGLAAPGIKNEKRSAPLAHGGQKREPRNDTRPATRQRRGKALLRPHKEQEEPETEKCRAKKAPEAPTSPAREAPQHKES